MNNLTVEMLPTLIMAIGVLAFVVSIITEVFKGVSLLKNIPTDLVVIVLSLVLTIVAYFAYTQYADIIIVWYWIVAANIVGFLVAFVAMYGWSKLNDIWTRFNPNNKE